ncbi:hypothetical protein M9458_039873, partial [Cirrhinus mrigala]
VGPGKIPVETQESHSLMELAEGAALWDGKEKRVAFIFPVLRRAQDCGFTERKRKDGDDGKKSKTALEETCEISQPGNARALLEDRTKLKVQECVTGEVDEVRERNVARRDAGRVSELPFQCPAQN